VIAPITEVAEHENLSVAVGKLQEGVSNPIGVDATKRHDIRIGGRVHVRRFRRIF
jgi:hypothetical protein